MGALEIVKDTAEAVDFEMPRLAWPLVSSFGMHKGIGETNDEHPKQVLVVDLQA